MRQILVTSSHLPVYRTGSDHLTVYRGEPVGYIVDLAALAFYAAALALFIAARLKA